MNSTFKLPDKHTQQHHVSSVETSSKEPRLLEDKLQVVLLASVLGNSSTKLEVNGHTGCSDDHTGNPKEESKTDTARQLQDTTGCGEDTGTDHSVEDQECSAQDTNLALIRSCFGMLTFSYIDQSVKVTKNVPLERLTSSTITLVAILVGTSLYHSSAGVLRFFLRKHT